MNQHMPLRANEAPGSFIFTHLLRAKALADQIGGYHLSLTIDTVVEAVVSLFTAAVTGGRRPRFRAHGGTNAENLALQVQGVGAVTHSRWDYYPCALVGG